MRESGVEKLLTTSLAALALLTGCPGGADPAEGDGKASKSIEGTYVLSRKLIEGTYVLSRWGDPGATPITRMVITVRKGTGFSVRREGTGFSVRGLDQAWSGEGRADGKGGYYDWVFVTGQTGNTTFTINPDGTLKGEVRGGIASWTYLARREKK
jgi:hypothetical protein